MGAGVTHTDGQLLLRAVPLPYQSRLIEQVNPRDAIHFSRASSPPHSTADSEADRNPGAEGTLEDIFKFDAELSDREDDGSSVSGA